MKNKILPILIVLTAMTMSGCDYIAKRFAHKHQSGTIVEAYGHYLYESDLVPVLSGLSGEDSIRRREQYVHDWLMDIVLYETAKDRADESIEAMVEDYRRSLYIHEYEQRLIAKRMQTMLTDSMVEQFYTEHSDRFILKESIVRGVLLIVPNDAPDINKVKKELQQMDETNMEAIEKYAYRYAGGYELFLDRWITANQLLTHMPFEKNTLNKELRYKQQIVLSDSLSTYILQVTDKYLQGEVMPLDYARRDIEPILINQLKKEFLRKESDKLYQDAIRYKHIQFYED